MTALFALAATAGVLSTGCGAYEPEPEYPQQVQYVALTPATSAELAAQQEARAQAAAESREILIGVDGDEYSDTDPSALTEFKPALDGHGVWVDDASYGTVWVPSREEVGDDFQPYVTAGHWTYSDATDYVWVSDYSWGWAPFHYGRWVHLPGHGWAWIPGRRYAGAWVTWRVGPAGYGYVGWAPAPPAWYWHHGVAYGWSYGWYNHHDHYVYCPRTYVYHQTVGTHVVRGAAARQQHYGRTQDYVPARPGTGGGDRVVASPSVNGGGRVVASPSVNGGGRVVASPSVSGGVSPGAGVVERAGATPGLGNGNRGPRPEELGLGHGAVVAPPTSNQGLSRAQAFASPATAVAAGAAAPAHLRPATQGAGVPNRGPASSASVPGGARGLAATNPAPSFANPSAPSSTAPSRSSAPAMRAQPSYAAPSAPSYAAPSPPFRSSAPAVRSTPSSPDPSPSFRSSAPAVRSTPSFADPSPSFRSSAPAVRSTPTPSVRPAPTPTPSFRSSTPSVRSTPTPSFRSSTPSVRSTPTPSFRSSTPSVRSTPSFRSSTPSVRSAPSRSSSPSRSSAPAVRSGGGFRSR
ncbi:MAG: hypothetical protein KF850_24070 [Labilithrix sp.]|nr:hypothetical protein [Labilithrix sp.]